VRRRNDDFDALAILTATGLGHFDFFAMKERGITLGSNVAGGLKAPTVRSFLGKTLCHGHSGMFRRY
jgi:hypothetical protein